jgi:hypothetical protein
MGKHVYQEILSIIADADYGDITDLKAGRDIVVEFKTAEETGKSFPETTIRVKPNQTPAFDPSDAALKEKVKNQKNVTELFPELSYEELASVMDTWLNSSQENAEDAEPAATTVTEETEAAPAAPAPKSATAKAAVKAPSSTKAIADEFNDLFNS